MNTSDGDTRTHRGGVDNEISDLAEEYVGGAKAQIAVTLILVTVNDPASGEARARLDDRKTVGIADDLSVVIIYDWS